MYSIEKAVVNQISWAKKHISVSMAFEPNRMGRFLGEQWNLTVLNDLLSVPFSPLLMWTEASPFIALVSEGRDGRVGASIYFSSHIAGAGLIIIADELLAGSPPVNAVALQGHWLIRESHEPTDGGWLNSLGEYMEQLHSEWESVAFPAVCDQTILTPVQRRVIRRHADAMHAKQLIDNLEWLAHSSQNDPSQIQMCVPSGPTLGHLCGEMVETMAAIREHCVGTGTLQSALGHATPGVFDDVVHELLDVVGCALGAISEAGQSPDVAPRVAEAFQSYKEKRERKGQWTAANKSGWVDWVEYTLALSRS